MVDNIRASIERQRRRVTDDHRTRSMLIRLRSLTAPLRLQPTFFVIGAQKCGTTALYAMLQEHPQISAPIVKETEYLTRWAVQPPRYWRAQFPYHGLRSQATITGEATPDYLFVSSVPKRLATLAPDARLIVITRDPSDRAYSAYQMMMTGRRGVEALSFEDALRSEAGRLNLGFGNPGSPEEMRQRHFGYMARGLYSEQVRRWFEWFPREQFHFLTNKDLATDQEAALQSVCKFLDIGRMPTLEPVRRNSFRYEPMSDEARTLLANRFKNEARDLEGLIGAAPNW